jgi:hypothetical protein
MIGGWGVRVFFIFFSLLVIFIEDFILKIMFSKIKRKESQGQIYLN